MATGVQGPFGPAGVQGPTGISGMQGVQGSAGSAGGTGVFGATGPTGQQLNGNGILVQALYSDLSRNVTQSNTFVPVVYNSGNPDLLLNESRTISGYYTFTGGTGINRYEQPFRTDASGFLHVSPGNYYISVSTNNYQQSSNQWFLSLDEYDGTNYSQITNGPISVAGTSHLQHVYQPSTQKTIAIRLFSLTDQTDPLTVSGKNSVVTFVRLW